MQVKCATWNVHRAKGTDGALNPSRIVEAIGTELAPLNLDVLALQEADGECRPHAGILDVHEIAALTGLTSVHDRADLRWGDQSDGFLGTILFLGPAFERRHADVIDLPGHCHRGLISVELVYQGKPLRVMSTHLSLAQPLRVVQMRIIGQYLRRRPPMQTVLLGDLNEWRPWGGMMLHRRLVGTAFQGPARTSFPSTRPLLPLDRILTDAPGEVREMRVLKTAKLMAASDHLPLQAVVTVP